LSELYAARAWDIRNRYDYIVLHFSGGSDSANILETFIQNGIHLDEILVRGSFSQNSNLSGKIDSTEQYAECLSQGIPLAQWAKDTHYPHLKISLVDTTDTVINYFKKNSDWMNYDLPTLSPGQAFKATLNELCPHYIKIVEKGKKICHIYGIDKPQIYKNKDTFYTRWLDEKARGNYMQQPTEDPLPYYIESFYWSAHTVLLQIKQLHLLKNYIKDNKISDYAMSNLTGRDYDNFVSSIIYQRTLPLITEHRKDAGTSIIKDRDAWFPYPNCKILNQIDSRTTPICGEFSKHPPESFRLQR
jgi:hypothetical protein